MHSQTSPIDGSLNFSQFIDTFLQKDPSELYATLAPPSGEGALIDISWPNFARAIHRGAHVVSPLMDGKPQIGAGNVVGIYAVTDTLLYATLILAVIRSGNIVSLVKSEN